MLVNLLSNAIKFTGAGEVVLEVTVEGRDVAGTRLHFSVRDTGIGIPPDKQDAIFDAFSQADASTTRQFGGTGLGLTISSHLTKLMGGRIWVESTLGQGSVFHVVVPFAESQRPARSEPPADVESLRNRSVLVVDDNATNCRILHDVLVQWGMVPTVVNHGEDALRALQVAVDTNRPFSLVLLDHQMPQMSGLDVAARIRGSASLAPTVILMLSSTDPQSAEDARTLGINASLIKPVRQAVLLRAILAALDRQAQPAVAKALPPPLPVDGRSLRILVAEDNAVNTKLIRALLDVRGHVTYAVTNGREAVATVETAGEAFDLALMDVQMPEMDGLEATAAIRLAEAGTSRHLPIVALTAHAMKGDREACLAAGMDGYLSKPVHAADLFALIESLVPGDAPVEAPPPASAACDEALSRVGGDRQLLAELVAMLAQEIPGAVLDLRRTLKHGDAKGLERAAHKLRGSVAQLRRQGRGGDRLAARDGGTRRAPGRRAGPTVDP